MTVYLDPLLDYSGMITSARAKRYGVMWSHMVCEDLAELHRFARQLGLRRAWFQDHPVHPHYDLTESLHDRAVEMGAVEVPFREIYAMRKAWLFKRGILNDRDHANE